MSTSLLYHGFGLRGYDYVRTRYVSSELIFHVSPKPGLLRCPFCNKGKVKQRGFSERKLRLPSMGRKLIYALVKVPRVESLSCGIVRQIKIGIAEPRRTYTHSFERLVLDLSQSMTMLDVARFLKIGWDTVAVFDHFHIVKLMNEHLTELRRFLYHELKYCLEKDVLKGGAVASPERPENLKITDKHDEKQHLAQALELNAP